VAEDRHDRLVPLLSHAQLLHARECQASAETSVRDQPKLCKASAEPVVSGISRIRTKSGADGRIRTGDPLFTKQLLCQLSYVGVRPDYMRPTWRDHATGELPKRTHS